MVLFIFLFYFPSLFWGGFYQLMHTHARSYVIYVIYYVERESNVQHIKYIQHQSHPQRISPSGRILRRAWPANIRATPSSLYLAHLFSAALSLSLWLAFLWFRFRAISAHTHTRIHCIAPPLHHFSHSLSFHIYIHVVWLSRAAQVPPLVKSHATVKQLINIQLSAPLYI